MRKLILTTLGVLSICTNSFADILLRSKVLLSGPYDSSIGLMHDSLRVKGLIPFNEPYFAKQVLGVPSGETVSTAILSVEGNDAIVDWIFIELRSSTNNAEILVTKRALLQRDGDIVSNEDGVSPVFFPGIDSGNYYISIKHRNHLGVMTYRSIYLSSMANEIVDFSLCSVWTRIGEANPPRRVLNGIALLWSSDANENKNSKYNGAVNDRQEILNTLGSTNINSSIPMVYRLEDLNMDGTIKYNNSNNDRSVILSTVGIVNLSNIVNQHTPN